MSLTDLVKMSNRYGSNEEFVLAGGGNTSFKEDGVLYVKSSGFQLSNIKKEQFVVMKRDNLLDMIKFEYPESMTNEEKDKKSLEDMMAARLPGEEEKRPSIESALHALFPYKLVLHVHPPMINGLTCAINGKIECENLFGDKVVWIDLTKPGLVLAQTCNKIFNEYNEKMKTYPQIVLMQNHGIFVAADTLEEIDDLMDYVVNKIKSRIKETPDFSEITIAYDPDSIYEVIKKLETLYSENGDGNATVLFCINKQVLEVVSDKESFKPVSKPFTPDHIVYCKDEPLFTEPDSDITDEFNLYKGKKGFKPNITVVRGLGFFASGIDEKKASQAKALFLDTIKIATYAKSFGGVNPLNDEFTNFILNWEIEAYRAKV